MLIKRDDTYSVNLGRVTVVWDTHRGQVRLVDSRVGTPLTVEDTPEGYSLSDFKAKVKEYQTYIQEVTA